MHEFASVMHAVRDDVLDYVYVDILSQVDPDSELLYVLDNTRDTMRNQSLDHIWDQIINEHI